MKIIYKPKTEVEVYSVTRPLSIGEILIPEGAFVCWDDLDGCFKSENKAEGTSFPNCCVPMTEDFVIAHSKFFKAEPNVLSPLSKYTVQEASILISDNEVETEFTRVQEAEMLLNTPTVKIEFINLWLLNYGTQEAAQKLRAERGISWDDKYQCASPLSRTLDQFLL